MSLLANSNAIESGGYNIERSLRFRSSASAYLSRTPASAGNRKTWTYSEWIKRGALGTSQFIFGTGSGSAGSVHTSISFNASDQLDTGVGVIGTGTIFTQQTNAVFRDPSAHMHLVLVYDTSNATSTERVRIYVNGVRLSVSGTYPAQNYDCGVNTTQQHRIGSFEYSPAANLDGYIAQPYLIDGQALTPSSFGETDSITGVWKPKKYTGTYGTNGFYLDFKDNTSATTLAYDKSGNGNNWTCNNISLTSGVTYDSMLDVPTPYADGGNGRGNYPVINPLNNSGGTTIADGNLKTTWGSASSRSVLNTMAIPDSGKFYAEFVVGSLTNANVAASFGLATASVSRTSDGYGASGAWVYYASNQSYISRNGTSSAQIGSNQTFAAGGIVQIAVDRTNNQAWLGYNNVWVNATNGTDGNPSAGINPTVSSLPADLFIIMGLYANSGNVNFGQRPFAYTPPTGFKALNTQNLPEPTIKKGNQYFDATTYTGNGSTGKAVSNAGSFQPDFVWIKDRSAANFHILTDAIRGAGYALYSNGTYTESAFNAQTLQSFNAGGFTVGSNGDVNTNGATYVGWQWKAGGTAVSNTAGSITSQVSANTTAGFSIVTYTGTGANATVGHGLGVAPKMVIVKARSGTGGWETYTSTTGAGNRLRLNETAASTADATAWNSTAPTSSVFSIGTNGNINTNTVTHVAYCWAEIPGFSKFGSYTGNGSADGPFVYCGFRPKFVLMKRTDTVGSWYMLDSARNLYNVTNSYLNANSSAAEFSNVDFFDFLSNGFKLRTSNGEGNANGGTYIYMVFAENPFKYSLAR